MDDGTDARIDDLAVAPGSDDLRIGQNIARLRKEQGLSQRALADAMRQRGFDHWRQNTVSRLETGKQQIATAELEPLTEVLGGEILFGTRLVDSLRKIMAAHRDRALANKLREAEAHLEASLESLRWNLLLLDPTYRHEQPELWERFYGGAGDDAEHQEEG